MKKTEQMGMEVRERKGEGKVGDARNRKAWRKG